MPNRHLGSNHEAGIWTPGIDRQPVYYCMIFHSGIPGMPPYIRHPKGFDRYGYHPETNTIDILNPQIITSFDNGPLTDFNTLIDQIADEDERNVLADLRANVAGGQLGIKRILDVMQRILDRAVYTYAVRYTYGGKTPDPRIHMAVTEQTYGDNFLESGFCDVIPRPFYDPAFTPEEQMVAVSVYYNTMIRRPPNNYCDGMLAEGAERGLPKPLRRPNGPPSYRELSRRGQV